MKRQEQKLTSPVRMQVTEDWYKHFPSLGIYRPMWMLRRCGPLINGVLLDRMTGNASYRPLWHITMLGTGEDSLPLTLDTPLSLNRHGVAEDIRMLFHTSEKVAIAAKRLREQALLPLEGPLSKSQVLAAYQDFMSRKFWYNTVSPHHIFSDIVRLHAWCGDSETASKAARDFAKQLAKDFYDRYSSVQMSEWLETQLQIAANPSQLREQVEKDLDMLNLRNLPENPFLCGQ